MDLGSTAIVFSIGLVAGIGCGLLIGHRLRTRYAERYNELAARAKEAGIRIHNSVDDL